jgi:molybdopterin synthase catalytic subunit
MKSEYLTEGPLTAEQIHSLISSVKNYSDAGGISFFLGQVRADIIDGKVVKAIEYSAYEEMVSREAERIISDIRSEFPDVKNIGIVHSTGLVKAGELSLSVLVSAGHRQQAIGACTKTVELIKERFPVWKKEIFEDNSYHWRENP